MNYWVVGCNELHRAMWIDVEKLNNATYLDHIFINHSLVEEKLLQLILGSRKGDYLPHFIKKRWYKYYTLSHVDLKEGKNCIILTDNRVCQYSMDYLRFLKKKYHVVYALVYLNPYITSGKGVLDFLELADYIFTYDKEDAEKYHYIYIPTIYSGLKIDMGGNERDINCDIFYIGEARDRLEKIQNCFEYLDSHNVKCDFTITGVYEEQKRYQDKIKYNIPLPYSSVLDRINKSNCVLEILREGQPGITLRTLEAIVYNKKLLTNNEAIKELPFYNEKFMKVFSAIEDIDIEFITKREDVIYDYNGECSPIKIIERIEEIGNESGV